MHGSRYCLSLDYLLLGFFYSHFPAYADMMFHAYKQSIIITLKKTYFMAAASSDTWE